MEGKGEEDLRTKREKCNEAHELNGEAETPEALLNDVVLQNILKYLGFKDLKSCREVGNKTWLRNSKKAWWSRTKVRVTGCKADPKFIQRYFNQAEIISNPTNYTLVDIQRDFYGFWEHFGHSIKYLELQDCRFRSQDEFRHVIYSQCPSLEKLVIYGIKIDGLTDMEHLHDVEHMKWQEPEFGHQNNLKSLKIVVVNMPLPWMEFLSHFPKLQDLEDRPEKDEIFQVISMIRQHDPKMLKLKHIQLHPRWTRNYNESIRGLFLDPSLSLETILIDLKKCKTETLAEVLELHAKSLKKLILEGDTVTHPILRYPPQPLQVLEELQVRNCIFPADIFKFTPNVRKVEFSYLNPSSYNILERVEPNLKVNTCKDFRLWVQGHWRDTPDSDFEFFLSAFPNVETLYTRELNNNKFSTICERLTKLKFFAIDSSKVDITGLLGFDPKSNDNAGFRHPNITNLKVLESFSMGSNDFMRGVVMKNGSDISKELNRLPNLKKFELQGYQFPEDEETWKEIFAKYSGP